MKNKKKKKGKFLEIFFLVLHKKKLTHILYPRGIAPASHSKGHQNNLVSTIGEVVRMFFFVSVRNVNLDAPGNVVV